MKELIEEYIPSNMLREPVTQLQLACTIIKALITLMNSQPTLTSLVNKPLSRKKKRKERKRDGKEKERHCHVDKKKKRKRK